MEVASLENIVNGQNGESNDPSLVPRQPFRFRSALTGDSFERLLRWLAPVREDAGEQYEEIRNTLIKIFTYRGCPIAEELADETINRVAEKTGQIVDKYVGQPHKYFYGVANKVHLEYLNRPKLKMVPTGKEESPEPVFRCLDSCLERLKLHDRRLALAYYGNESGAKISERKAIAESLGISQNALRIRLYEIRASLRVCVENCTGKGVSQ